MYGEMEDNIKVLLLLKELLSGNREICYNILQMKIQKERDEIFLESQDFWIENNFYNWRHYRIQPVQGKLLLFGSNIEHCVERQLIDSNRITIAVNYK